MDKKNIKSSKRTFLSKLHIANVYRKLRTYNWCHKNVNVLLKHGNSEELSMIEQTANRERVLNYYRKHDCGKFEKELKYLEKNMPQNMNCSDKFMEYRKAAERENSTILWDNINKSYYVEHNHRKMYFKKSMLKDEAIKYYTSVLFEQSEYSPHCYTSDDFSVESESILFDIGAAEGIFALDYVNVAKEIYIFECDKAWIDALKLTFAPYLNVHIVERYISNITDENKLTLALDDMFGDDFCKKENIFIKMDIEGEEVQALIGCKDIIRNSKKIKMAVCTYHKENHFQIITEVLEQNGMKCKTTKGYLLMLYGKMHPPFFRHALCLAEKEN